MKAQSSSDINTQLSSQMKKGFCMSRPRGISWLYFYLITKARVVLIWTNTEGKETRWETCYSVEGLNNQGSRTLIWAAVQPSNQGSPLGTPSALQRLSLFATVEVGRSLHTGALTYPSYWARTTVEFSIFPFPTACPLPLKMRVKLFSICLVQAWGACNASNCRQWESKQGAVPSPAHSFPI